MHFRARLTRRQFFRPLFLCKNRFLEPKIKKKMIFSKIMVLRATTASTQKHTHSCCFLIFFFGGGIFSTRRHPQLRSKSCVFLAKIIINHRIWLFWRFSDLENDPRINPDKISSKKDGTRSVICPNYENSYCVDYRPPQIMPVDDAIMPEYGMMATPSCRP